jgi:hypothetical protein
VPFHSISLSSVPRSSKGLPYRFSEKFLCALPICTMRTTCRTHLILTDRPLNSTDLNNLCRCSLVHRSVPLWCISSVGLQVSADNVVQRLKWPVFVHFEVGRASSTPYCFCLNQTLKSIFFEGLLVCGVSLGGARRITCTLLTVLNCVGFVALLAEPRQYTQYECLLLLVGGGLGSRSRDSSVSSLGCGLKDRLSAAVRRLSPQQPLDRLWGSAMLLSSGYRRLFFLGSKAAGA